MNIDALLKIESYAPHMLTPEDRRALRLYRAAPAVKRGSIAGVVLCALGLLALIWRMK